MGKAKTPVTPAVRMLRTAGVSYTEYVFDYNRFPGATGAAEATGIGIAEIVKTLIMEDSEGSGLILLELGDREVSTKQLARILGVKAVTPASADKARRWTGYRFGGTSPLGVRTPLPVIADAAIAELDRVFINAGKRGFMVGMDTSDLLRLTQPRLEAISA